MKVTRKNKHIPRNKRALAKLIQQTDRIKDETGIYKHMKDLDSNEDLTLDVFAPAIFCRDSRDLFWRTPSNERPTTPGSFDNPISIDDDTISGHLSMSNSDEAISDSEIQEEGLADEVGHIGSSMINLDQVGTDGSTSVV
jgi:hypothetical protein